MEVNPPYAVPALSSRHCIDDLTITNLKKNSVHFFKLLDVNKFVHLDVFLFICYY